MGYRTVSKGTLANAVDEPLIWFPERLKNISAVSVRSPAGMGPAEWVRLSVSKRRKAWEHGESGHAISL